jgi:hypothetical protein
LIKEKMVGMRGFEPPISCTQNKRLIRTRPHPDINNYSMNPISISTETISSNT